MSDQPKRPVGRPPGSGHPKQLSPKQSQFVAAYLRHGNCIQAARESGFSPTYAGSLILVPAVADAIAAARMSVQIKSEYNLQAAMDEAADAMAFARKTENATALIRGVEIRAKLQGLMVEKIDQRNIGGFVLNISGIDDAAKAAAATPSYKDIFSDDA